MSKERKLNAELTAKMHASLLEEDGLSYEDTMILAAYAKVMKGVSKDAACKAYGITVKTYDENIDRVLKS